MPLVGDAVTAVGLPALCERVEDCRSQLELTLGAGDLAGATGGEHRIGEVVVAPVRVRPGRVERAFDVEPGQRREFLDDAAGAGTACWARPRRVPA